MNPVWRYILRFSLISFLWSFAARHGPTTSSESSQPGGSGATEASHSPSGSIVPALRLDDTPIRADWSVKLDGTINPSIKVELEHVWSHEASVYSAKFSPDGRYLAVAAENGKTYIYYMRTRRKIWLALIIMIRMS